MTIGDLARCLSNYDIITIFQDEKMIYDGLVKDLNDFLNEQILKIDIIDYKQLHVKI